MGTYHDYTYLILYPESQTCIDDEEYYKIFSDLRNNYPEIEENIDEYGSAYGDGGWNEEVNFIFASKDYPHYIFVVYDTNSYGEFGKSYYYQGKVQHVGGEVVYPEFDPSELKEIDERARPLLLDGK
jgi:hypothetical protein